MNQQTHASHFAVVQWASSAKNPVAFLILSAELLINPEGKMQEKNNGLWGLS